MEYALRAVAMNGASNADDLDTLAEAYYVNGDYRNAIVTEKKALALQADDVTRAAFEKALAKYELAQAQAEPRTKGRALVQHEVQLSCTRL
jgi:hypothetical protein